MRLETTLHLQAITMPPTQKPKAIVLRPSSFAALPLLPATPPIASPKSFNLTLFILVVDESR
jgi:hypothetical protein